MTAKRHHAVPQFYLRRFANSKGMLWLHDIERLTAGLVHTSNAMVEKYLYSPEVGDDPHDDSIERFLAEHVEGPAASPLEKLANGDVLSSEERQHLATFLAFQEARIPRMRDNVTSFASELGQKILNLSIAHPESMKAALAKKGHPIPDAILAHLSEAVRTGGIRVEATKMAWLQATLGTGEIAEMLFRLPWFVVEAYPGVEFLTSDAPIVKVLTDRSVPRQFAGGWLSPSSEATFALDPLRCLVIRPDGKEGRGRVSKLWCKNVNSRLVSQAKRFVGSSSRDGYVESIGARRPKRSSLRQAAL